MDKLFAAFGGTTKAVDFLVKVVMAAIVFFILRNLYIKWMRRNTGKATVNSANLVPGKNYDNVAKQCYDVFDVFFTSTPETGALCDQLMSMNDDEIKQINNRYLTLYGKGTKTLQDAIEGAFWGAPGDSTPCGLLLNRMSVINLN